MKSTTPKVSVIVPVYNVEPYLKRCVESLRNQTLKDIEIILVDDKSPDNCPALCDQYANQDTRIKVIHKQVNEGLGMACNSGIELATSEYIAFCDSDDWVDHEMYKTMYDVAQRENAQIVFSGIRRIDKLGNSNIMSVSDKFKVSTGNKIVEKVALDMIASSPEIRQERCIAMSAKIVIYKRDVLMNNHIRFESERKMISEDLLFNLDCLFKCNKVVEIPNVFYNYFVNATSLTGVIRKDRCDKYLLLYKEILTRYPSKRLLLQERVNRMFIGYVRDELTKIALNKQFSFVEKHKIIARICNYPIWKDLYKSYPIKKMPLHHMLHFLAIRLKLINLLIVCSHLK